MAMPIELSKVRIYYRQAVTKYGRNHSKFVACNSTLFAKIQPNNNANKKKVIFATHKCQCQCPVTNHVSIC